MNSLIACPLCQSNKTSSFHRDSAREYLQCVNCNLVFVPSHYHLSEIEERARYDSHNNDPKDVRYRQFLSQLVVPLQERILSNSNGLDFGSGPGPTLSLMLEECGHKVELYDKFYANNVYVFERKYDFITATEVLEHLSEPMLELKRLVGLLKDKGYLAIMTQLLTSKIDFNSWYYKNDPSHIIFFSKETLNFLADYFDVEVFFISERVVFFKK